VLRQECYGFYRTSWYLISRGENYDHQDIREQLYRLIDRLPDEDVEQIADFTLFIMSRRQRSSQYIDWQNKQWQAFTLEQFFGEEEEVEYTLDDAQEVYRP
jgi:hypothetical protein